MRLPPVPEKAGVGQSLNSFITDVTDSIAIQLLACHAKWHAYTEAGD